MYNLLYMTENVSMRMTFPTNAAVAPVAGRSIQLSRSLRYPA